MSFRDFLAVTRPELPRPGPLAPWDLQSRDADTAAAAAELSTDAMDLAWQAYLTCGGYPRAVSKYHRLGQVGEAFLRDLEEWLHRDVDRDAPEESIPRLLAELHTRTGSPLNRSQASAGLGYQTRQSFDLRLNRLVRTFAALWCHQVTDQGRRIPGAQAKLYLADPILAWLAPRLRAGNTAPDATRLAESALGIALATAVEAQQPGRWVTDEAIGYLRTGSGSEVDFAPMPLPSPGGPVASTPLESTWVSHNWRPESRALVARLGRGVVATKNITDTTSAVWALPAPLVALLLG